MTEKLIQNFVYNQFDDWTRPGKEPLPYSPFIKTTISAMNSSDGGRTFVAVGLFDSTSTLSYHAVKTFLLLWSLKIVQKGYNWLNQAWNDGLIQVLVSLVFIANS